MSGTRAVLHRRLRHARRRLHLERHRRSRPRRAGRAHALAADPVRAGERRRPPRRSWSLQALVGLAVLLQFNRFTIMTGFASLAVVAIYPFMKRITYWPQIVLGLAFSWGALMGWPAAFGRLDWPALSALCRLDRLGDRLRHHLCASGSRGRCADRDQIDGAAVRRAHQADAGGVLRARGGVAGAGRMERRRRRRLLRSGWWPSPAHLAWQIRRLDIDDPALCLAVFKSNRDAGLILFAALALDAMRLV